MTIEHSFDIQSVFHIVWSNSQFKDTSDIRKRELINISNKLSEWNYQMRVNIWAFNTPHIKWKQMKYQFYCHWLDQQSSIYFC